MGANMETERRFLIAKPDEDALRTLSDCSYTDIVQTYLISRAGETERVRMREGGGICVYTHTQKKRVSLMSSIENERIIDKAEYESLLLQKDPAKKPIHKRRYALNQNGFVFEIDLYPFWQKQAIMEVELPSEDTHVEYPAEVRILREITGNRAYSNASMASSYPVEDE